VSADEQRGAADLRKPSTAITEPAAQHPASDTLSAGVSASSFLATFFNSRKGVEAMKKIRPLQDRILVKRLEEKETKKGGIIIPDTAKEKPQEGEVIAVGPGKVTDDGKRQPMEVKAGDKILFGKYSGSEVKLGDDEYLIMREEDVLGILQ
jgi:chaperonin GroES